VPCHQMKLVALHEILVPGIQASYDSCSLLHLFYPFLRGEPKLRCAVQNKDAWKAVTEKYQKAAQLAIGDHHRIFPCIMN